jgi:uncharacterized glyoxalase superfamily protein PhnB
MPLVRAEHRVFTFSSSKPRSGQYAKSRLDRTSLALTVGAEPECRWAFDALAHGGSVPMPLTKTFWSPCYGMLTDRFGLDWMVMVPQTAAK